MQKHMPQFIKYTDIFNGQIMQDEKDKQLDGLIWFNKFDIYT